MQSCSQYGDILQLEGRLQGEQNGTKEGEGSGSEEGKSIVFFNSITLIQDLIISISIRFFFNPQPKKGTFKTIFLNIKKQRILNIPNGSRHYYPDHWLATAPYWRVEGTVNVDNCNSSEQMFSMLLCGLGNVASTFN